MANMREMSTKRRQLRAGWFPPTEDGKHTLSGMNVGVLTGYARYLEELVIQQQADAVVSDDVIEVDDLYELIDQITDRNLTAWQRNQLKRWDEQRRRTQAAPIVLLAPMQHEKEPDPRDEEIAELKSKLASMWQQLQELETAHTDACRKLNQARIVLRD